MTAHEPFPRAFAALVFDQGQGRARPPAGGEDDGMIPCYQCHSEKPKEHRTCPTCGESVCVDCWASQWAHDCHSDQAYLLPEEQDHWEEAPRD